MAVKKIKRYFSSAVWWSVISAAFIGPGTVTTAAKAGSDFGLSLFWTIAFAILACFVLQEAVARLSFHSKMSLGENISLIFKYPFVKYLIGCSVIVGCMAFEAGNILGSIEGLKMMGLNTKFLSIIGIGLISFLVLSSGGIKRMTFFLGLFVAIMGISFLIVAFSLLLNHPTSLFGIFKPKIPSGSGLIIVGLLGTTIVPYNLFLGSGISNNQSINEMRWGMSISIFCGGLITAAILVTGSFISSPFQFEMLYLTIQRSSGSFSAILVGFGLFCAGISSAITAPLAAAFTAKSIFSKDQKNWAFNSRNFRTVWMFVLGIGVLFSLFDFQPISIIVSAQLLNGFILPLIAFTIIAAINSKKCIGENSNTLFQNILSIIVLTVCLLLSLKTFISIFNS